MSYLDVPRLHFAGTFIAKPSTVNNTPENFNPEVAITPQNESWNPKGSHAWQFSNCVIQSAVDSSGKSYTSSGTDPIIGAAVLSTDQPATAKLVDLDTEQQMVSQIWGLQIKVAISDTDWFMGDFRVTCFNDIFARVVNGRADSMFSAYYQSFLDNVSWGSQVSSPLLLALQNVSPARLSIKFVVDGYQDKSSLPNFNQGRIVGTIGPAFADEPSNFILGRALRPNVNVQNNLLNFGYARVDTIRSCVLVDLGNSIPTQGPASGPPNLGTLQVAIVPSSGNPIVLGSYDYSRAAYQLTAGIQEYSLTADQLAMLANTPLGVIQTNAPGGPAGPTILLQEGSNGTYITATQQVYRMNPGDIEVVELVAQQFGLPAAGQVVSLEFNNGPLQSQAAAGIPVGVPAAALSFPESVTTGIDGRASFPISATDPGNPRQFIDGQVYGVGYSWALDNDPAFQPDSNNFVSVLVFDSFTEPPTWKNIRPILQQYAKLYPFMDSIFQLDNPTVIQQNIDAFRMVLNIPIPDPRYMPVTREMSRDKRQRILEWLDLGAPTSGPSSSSY